MYDVSLRPLDVEFMKKLHHFVNIVPVIAKSDTLTQDEREAFKARVRPYHYSIYTKNNISSYFCVVPNRSEKISAFMASRYIRLPTQQKMKRKCK